MENRKKIEAALGVLRAVADAIRELGRVPYGVLYANVMAHIDLANLDAIVGTLERAGVIRREGDVLVWTGPVLE